MAKSKVLNDASLRYDPNAKLPEDLRAFGVERMAQVLGEGRGRVTPGSSILDFRIGYQRLLVYVRVTEEEHDREGTGILPEIVQAAAQRLDAQAHVVRIDVSRAGWGTGFCYWGLEEVKKAFRSSPCDWTAHFMGGERFWRTCRRARRPLSVLTVDPMIYFIGRETKKNQARERTAGVRSVVGEDEKVFVGLRIDGKRFYKGNTVCPIALAGSIHGSDEQFIFTCGCGCPECAGIEEGFMVLHSGDRVVWVVNSVEEPPVFVFDRRQYCEEVKEKLRMASKVGREEGAWIPYGVRGEDVLSALENGVYGGMRGEVIWQRVAG
jgi:hypothetical protein